MGNRNLPGPGDECTWGMCTGHPHDPRTQTYDDLFDNNEIDDDLFDDDEIDEDLHEDEEGDDPLEA